MPRMMAASPSHTKRKVTMPQAVAAVKAVMNQPEMTVRTPEMR